MGRKSKIENHPQRNIIITRLASGEEYSDIIRDFSGLTWDDLDYYKQNKLCDIISKSSDLKTEVESTQGNNTLAEVRALKARALEILEQAQSAGDLKTALMGIREARGCLELCMKAEGQIDARPPINISLNAEWISLRTTIITALERFPDARRAVIDALP
jgi:hypothetical protein